MKTIKKLEADLERHDRKFCCSDRCMSCGIIKAKIEALKDVLKLMLEIKKKGNSGLINYWELKSKIKGK